MSIKKWLGRSIFEQFNEMENNINKILDIVQDLQKKGVTIMADLTSLTAQVAENTSVEGSAITLIQNIAAELAAAGTDPAKLADLQDKLKTSSDALSAAIVANTPAA